MPIIFYIGLLGAIFVLVGLTIIELEVRSIVRREGRETDADESLV